MAATVNYEQVTKPISWGTTTIQQAIQWVHSYADKSKINTMIKYVTNTMNDKESPKDLCKIYVDACIDSRIMPNKCNDVVTGIIRAHTDILKKNKEQKAEYATLLNTYHTASASDSDKKIYWHSDAVSKTCNHGNFTHRSMCEDIAHTQMSINDIDEFCRNTLYPEFYTEQNSDSEKIVTWGFVYEDKDICNEFVKVLIDAQNTTVDQIQEIYEKLTEEEKYLVGLPR